MCMNTATSMEYHGIFIGIVNDRRIRLSRITYLSLPWALPSHATPQLIVAECDDYVTSNDAIAGELHGCSWNLCLELKSPQGHSSVKALGINFCAPVMSHATFWGSWYSWSIPKYERIASYSSICRRLEHGTCLFAKVGVQNEISQNVRDWTPSIMISHLVIFPFFSLDFNGLPQRQASIHPGALLPPGLDKSHLDFYATREPPKKLWPRILYGFILKNYIP